MNIIQIIEQEMERNPDKWKDIAAQRIEASYRKNGAIEAKEYNFSFVILIASLMVLLLTIIFIGIIALL